jgi:hypothetical protein
MHYAGLSDAAQSGRSGGGQSAVIPSNMCQLYLNMPEAVEHNLPEE